jgi:hypothetical protein
MHSAFLIKWCGTLTGTGSIREVWKGWFSASLLLDLVLCKQTVLELGPVLRKMHPATLVAVTVRRLEGQCKPPEDTSYRVES